MMKNNYNNLQLNNNNMKFTYPKVIGELLSLLEGGQLSGDSITIKLQSYSVIEVGYSLHELIEERFVSSRNTDKDIMYKLTPNGVSLLHDCMAYADTLTIT